MKAIGYEGYQGPRLTRQEQLARMHRVIENELTEKQRRAVLGYYVDKKTMPELAREFGVCKSTVCRTIQRAERRCAAACDTKAAQSFSEQRSWFEKISPDRYLVGGMVVGLTAYAVRDMKCARIG